MESTLSPCDSQNTVCDLKVDLMGQFRLRPDIDNFGLTARKDLALIAYLANSPGESQRRSMLAALLWSDSDDSRARESLKQSLLRLRRALPANLLCADRHTACLRLNRKQVDVTRVEDLIKLGSVNSVIEAADWVSEFFLGGLEDISSEYEDWRNARYQQLLKIIKEAMLKTMQQEMANGNLSQVENLAQRVLRVSPLDEESVRYLISAYCSDGRPRQARQTYNDLENRLQEELGVEPEPATRSLIESLASESMRSVASTKSQKPKIAVLRFSVGSHESSQQFFAEGLADDITTDLSLIKSVGVLPASSFAGLQGDLSRTLLARGVTHTLHGSVRDSDNRLRINMRLMDVQDNRIIWAQRYDCELEDIFDTQDAITAQIVRHLQIKLSADAAQGADHGTRNPHAYKMFHKGRSLYMRGINNHTLLAAKALLDRSIELDPGFARAYAQLAICESCLAMSIVNKTGEDYSLMVLEHARAALEMNADLALGHAAVGVGLYATGQYRAAEQALLNAIDLDKNLFEAQFFQARNLRQQGDHEGAVEKFRIAASLRPEDFRSSGLLGDALKACGHIEEANDAFEVAIERVETELEHHPDNAGALAFGAPMLAEMNRTEQAREWSAWALAIEPNDCLLRYNIARLFCILGNYDIARVHLEVAYDAPLLLQKRLALWMRYDQDFKPVASKAWFKHHLKVIEPP